MSALLDSILPFFQNAFFLDYRGMEKNLEKINKIICN